MDETKAMPSFDAMTKREYTIKEWLLFYKNVWTRNLTARTVDVMVDTARKAINPEEEVEEGGRMIPCKQRLELRKIYVQDAIDLLAQVDAMLDELTIAETDPVKGPEALKLATEAFVQKHYSKEALAVAPDMIPQAEEKQQEKEPDAEAGAAEGEKAPEGEPGAEAKV